MWDAALLISSYYITFITVYIRNSNAFNSQVSRSDFLVPSSSPTCRVVIIMAADCEHSSNHLVVKLENEMLTLWQYCTGKGLTYFFTYWLPELGASYSVGQNRIYSIMQGPGMYLDILRL